MGEGTLGCLESMLKVSETWGVGLRCDESPALPDECAGTPISDGVSRLRRAENAFAQARKTPDPITWLFSRRSGCSE
jgi:hypothetical protein